MTVVKETSVQPEELPMQEAPQSAAPKKTWICSQCKATINWLPEKVRHLPPSKICCLTCQKAKKGTEAPADVPPAHEAPKRAAQQHRQAGAPHRAQAPRGLTLEVVELCAFRAGVPSTQVEALLAALRSHMKTPSSDK